MSEDVRISKFLSYVLRHEPEAIGLELDEGGWADVDELLARARAHDRPLDRETIERVVATSEKNRFQLAEQKTKIRANYGHSIEVDLGLEPETPPERLCHGTARQFLENIRREGLRSKGRQWVHLNEADAAGRRRAREVGGRHGEPVVLEIATERVDADFYRSESEIWLVAFVPPEALVCSD